MTFNWPINLFKGRIGEAVVEAVLSEFGYLVKRNGSEFRRRNSPSRNGGLLTARPDLEVTDPQDNHVIFVEVKVRSARPMSIPIDPQRLLTLQQHFPGTILVFVSSYDGSVNCRKVDEVDVSHLHRAKNGLCQLDLLDNAWQAISHYFPLVRPGRRLTRLWLRLEEELHLFGERRIRFPGNHELFEEEKEALICFLQDHWIPEMLAYDIVLPPQLDNLPLDQLRQMALAVHRFGLALKLHGIENVQALEFFRTIEWASGNLGEQWASLDLRAIRSSLAKDKSALAQFDALVQQLMNQAQHPKPGLWFLEELLKFVPPEIGRAFLSGPSSMDQVEIDLRTALALARKRNRLDYVPQ
ncbi:MAG: hypothetical protein HY535_01875 [Chloroflexi bacterium]|nr:hypothetical protein [Chloroflexota bacterium]